MESTRGRVLGLIDAVLFLGLMGGGVVAILWTLAIGAAKAMDLDIVKEPPPPAPWLAPKPPPSVALPPSPFTNR